MGVGVSKGENRIVEAVKLAVNCPLLETTIEGAQGVILNVVGGNDLTFAEVADAAELVRSVVDASANIIFGARIDPNVQDEVEITAIATGFPGYENTQTEEQQRAYTSGQLYTNQTYNQGQGRMSVNEPYYPQQRYASPQPQIQPPVRTAPPAQYSQPPQYVQPAEQPAVKPAEQEPQVERPSDKQVPKFAQLLHRFGRKDGDR